MTANDRSPRPVPNPATVTFDVVFEFLARFCADREAGEVRALRDYLALFPGWEEIVAREYLRMVRGVETRPSISVGQRTLGTRSSTADDRLAAPAERYEPIGVEKTGAGVEVLAARDLAIEREVRIVVPSSDDRSLARRFRRWVIDCGARLSHPNIVPVHDLGTDSRGRPFCVMDPLLGVPVDDYVRDDQRTTFVRLATLRQAALAVAYAHSQKCAHGSLDGDAIRVGDFGAIMIGRWYRARLAGDPVRRRDDTVAIARLVELTVSAPDQTGLLEDKEVETALRSLIDRCRARRAISPTLVGERIQSILDGAEDRRRRRREAARSIGVAERRESEREGWAREAESRRTSAALAKPETWRSIAEKRRYWKLLAEVDQADREAGRCRDESLLALEAAHRWDPGDPRWLSQLIDRYKAMSDGAHDSDSSSTVEFAERRLRSFGIREVDRWVDGYGTLAVECDPPPDRVTVRPMAERDRRRIAHGRHRLLASEGGAFRWTEAPRGAYQVTIESDGFAKLTAPVVIRRETAARVHWRLRHEDEIAPGFCHVPGGAADLGGDRWTHDALSQREVEVREFAISEFPVTCQEYAEYLTSLIGTRALSTRIPKDENGELPWFESRPSRVRVSERHARLPVVGITWNGAVAYCKWKSQCDGRVYRLPSDFEWEKAARGTDRRWYPWGDSFDAAFCKCASSRKGEPRIEVVGRFAADRSPYGVRDLGGGVMDWCRSWFSKTDGQRLIRGGAWSRAAIASRCAYRAGAPPAHYYGFVGMRMVHYFDETSGS